MAQLILLLFFLFSVSCVFYGIAAGVRGVQRSWVDFLENCGNKKKIKIKTNSEPNNQTDNPSPAILSIEELKILFDLYQTGALTRTEYEQCKKHILSLISKS